MNRLNTAPRSSADNGSQLGGSVQRNDGCCTSGRLQPDGGRKIVRDAAAQRAWGRSAPAVRWNRPPASACGTFATGARSEFVFARQIRKCNATCAAKTSAISVNHRCASMAFALRFQLRCGLGRPGKSGRMRFGGSGVHGRRAGDGARQAWRAARFGCRRRARATPDESTGLPSRFCRRG